MKIFLLCLALFFLHYGYAQDGRYEDGEYYYGFKGGANYHRINGIATTIIAPFYKQETYSTTIEPQIGYLGGIFFYHRFKHSFVAIQPEVTYSRMSSGFAYTDVDDLQYQIDFRYDYLNVAAYCKVYLFGDGYGGFHLAAGPQLSFNISNEKIFYDSNRPQIGPNLQIQQNLRDVLKGETLFSLGFGMGYDFAFGLTLEARYYLGLSDAIETQANGYFFIENDNRTTTFQLTAGFAIPFATYY